MDAVSSVGQPVSCVEAVGTVDYPVAPTNGMLNTFGLVTQFDIAPVSPISPVLTITSISATNIVLCGMNGVPGGIYSVVSAADLTSPRAVWTSISNGAFDSNGSFCLTNPIPPNAAQRFYTLAVH
jgi:hypothetical protein